MENKKKTILLAISGGIAAYKALDVISGLQNNGFLARVISTQNALDFVTPRSIGAISEGNYVEDFSFQVFSKSVFDGVNEIRHIKEAQSCDAFICVPATANIIAKFANGIADDFVSSTFVAIPKKTPKIICPAMNTVMYESCATTDNLKKLSEWGCHIIEPDKGKLACGVIGKGKLPKPRKIVENVSFSQKKIINL